MTASSNSNCREMLEPDLVKPYPFTAAPPPKLSGDHSAAELIHRLRDELHVDAGPDSAEVWGVEDEGFKTSAVIFNGAVRTHAIMLARPRSTTDVSIIVKYCRQYKLDLSVKAGGRGVHGWSVAGHVILDMSLLNEVSINLPANASSLQESFAQLDIEKAQRPSLAAMHARSSDSTTASVKRSTQDASLSDENLPDEKRRMGDILEEPVDDDQDMSRHVSNDTESQSGSGSSSRLDNRAESTPATSVVGSEHAKMSPSISISNSPAAVQGSLPGQSSSSHHPQMGRMTYVNPSPTTSSSFSFAQPSLAGTPAAFQQSFPETFLGPSRPVLNTNPDPPPYTVVTFGAGVMSKQLDGVTSASEYGAFHVPTSAFPVGTGQFISGGFGFVGRLHGMAMDNLLEAEIVLADGRIVWVGEGGKHGGEWKEGEDPEEVWWGIRGAGAALGVVTRFRAKAYYIPSVYAGNFIYVFDKNTTPSLLRHVRDCIKGAPRTVYANIIITAGPPGSPAIVVIQLCFSGPRSEGDLYIQAISSWEGGRCLFQDFSERTFERQQVAVEEVLKGGQGRKWYIKSDMLLSMTDEVIDETCSRFHIVPDGCTWLFEFTGGGKLAEVTDSCFPVSHRESAFTVAALHQWGHTEPAPLDTRCVTTAEDWILEVIHPRSPGGPLPCFIKEAKESIVAGVFGENWPRLQLLKAKLDPTNFFRHGPWPRQGQGASGIARMLGTDHPNSPSIASLTGLETAGEGKGKAREKRPSSTAKELAGKLSGEPLSPVTGGTAPKSLGQPAPASSLSSSVGAMEDLPPSQRHGKAGTEVVVPDDA